jgi:hypothetical protein
MRVALRLEDDDNKGILLDGNVGFKLIENGAAKTISVIKFLSKPFFDVNITVELPTSVTPFMIVRPAKSFLFQKDSWNNINCSISFKALVGIPSEDFVIRLRSRSMDPKYNLASTSVEINAAVETLSRSLDIITEADVGDGETFAYTAKLSTPLKSNSIVTMIVSSNVESCLLETGNVFTFTANNAMISIPLSVRVSQEKCTITHILSSTDTHSPYNNMEKKLTISIAKTPNTTIIHSPPIISARQQASFTFSSPMLDVTSFDWRINAGKYTNIPCAEKACIKYFPFLEYGSHIFEVKAVSNSGRSDKTPAIFSWEISHCNDGNRIPQQYAKIDTIGTLECIDCPHRKGANCKKMDVEWDGVYANPNWWTLGDKRDTYYKCPFKNACLGGARYEKNVNGTKIWNTTKSRCAKGYTGVVCAICADGYYMTDDLCTKCLSTEGGAQTLVILVFSSSFGIFLLLLVRQMRVHDSKFYWEKLRNSTIKKKRELSNAANGIMKKKR